MIMVFIVTCLFVAIVINTYMYTSTKESIDLDSSFDADCILILGAGVKNNQPTPMLRDRLLKGIELYNDHKAPKIIMSGDHSKEDYNEVGVMKQFAIKQGILLNRKLNTSKNKIKLQNKIINRWNIMPL